MHKVIASMDDIKNVYWFALQLSAQLDYLPLFLVFW